MRNETEINGYRVGPYKRIRIQKVEAALRQMVECEGMSPYTAGKRLGLSAPTVSDYAKILGLKPGYKPTAQVEDKTPAVPAKRGRVRRLGAGEGGAVNPAPKAEKETL